MRSTLIIIENNYNPLNAVFLSIDGCVIVKKRRGKYKIRFFWEFLNCLVSNRDFFLHSYFNAKVFEIMTTMAAIRVKPFLVPAPSYKI